MGGQRQIHAAASSERVISAKRRSKRIFIASGLLSLALSLPALAQQAAPDVFPDPLVPVEPGLRGLERVAGPADIGPVQRGVAQLRLQLPDGRTIQLVSDGFERRRQDDATWRGRVAPYRDSRAVLTVKNGYMAGTVTFAGEEYEILPGADGKHSIEKIDPGFIWQEGTPIVPPVAAEDPAGTQSPTTSPAPTTSPEPLTAAALTDTADNIHVMVVYTPQARASAGGKAQIETLIQAMVDQTNTAFIDSNMIARFSLVHSAEVTYNDSQDMSADLSWIAADATVASLRNTYGADMVSLLIGSNTTTGYCGLGYLMTAPSTSFATWAFQVTWKDCGSGTYAHEHGHNMGFEHDPDNSTSLPANASYVWSFGHSISGVYRTIMSYGCVTYCEKVMLFSNPDISYLGYPAGIANERDNARTGDATASIVANFRAAVVDPALNAAYTAESRVSMGTDDAEESYGGGMYLYDTYLDLGGANKGRKVVGLRFPNLSVPRGAQIQSAYVDFSRKYSGSVSTVMTIRAEASDNAQTFSSAAYNITARPVTVASVAWTAPAWSQSLLESTTDIGSVIQEVVNRPGWMENNDIVVTFTASAGTRQPFSYDGGIQWAPRLRVRYTLPPLAGFSHSCIGRDCSFTDSSTDWDGTVSAWSWNFGDGTKSTARNPSHSYAADGTYTVTLTATDNDGLAGSVAKSIVAKVNTAPVATNNSYTVNEDFAVSGNVLTDGTPDSDADGDTLSVTGKTNPSNGSLTIASNGAFTYTPKANFNGADSFTYTVSDGTATATATVSITVKPVNDAPVATANTYLTTEDTAKSGNILTDGTPDSDIDGDALSVAGYTKPSNGTVTVAANGAFTYTPKANFNGSDGFTYTLSDGKATATASVSITVTAVNDAPVATANAYTTVEDSAVSGNVLTDGTPDSDPDGNPLSVTGKTNPSNGSLTMAASGAFTYTPKANFNGSDSFTYTVSDGLLSATATVSITVNPVNDAPLATDNAYTTDMNMRVTGNFLTDGTPDSDVDGDSLTTVGKTAPVNGRVRIYADGSFIYRPSIGFVGSDSFTYTVSDGAATATATVSITVNDAAGTPPTSGDVSEPVPVYPGTGGSGYTYLSLANTAPNATDNIYVLAAGTAIGGNLMLDGVADSDADGDSLAVVSYVPTVSGRMVTGSDGSFIYEPNPGFTGLDSAQYTISDGRGGTATAQVTFTVD